MHATKIYETGYCHIKKSQCEKGAANKREKNSNGEENMRSVSDFKFNTRFFNILMKVDLNVEKKQVIAVWTVQKAQCLNLLETVQYKSNGFLFNEMSTSFRILSYSCDFGQNEGVKIKNNNKNMRCI